MSLIQSTLDETYKRLSEVLAAKNADYSGGENEFRNFDLAESVVGISAEQGILVRMTDKIARVANLIGGNEPKVKDEKLDDSILDLIGYAVILRARLEERTAASLIASYAQGQAEQR